MRCTTRTCSRSLAGSLAISVVVALAACDSGPKAGEEAKYWGEKLMEGPLEKRQAAMQHLVELKDPKSLPYLYEALKGPAPEIKPEAAQLIGLLGDQSSIDPLLGAIDWAAGAGRDKETRLNANTNEKIAKALGRIGKGDDPKTVDALKRLTAANNPDVQLAAVVTLGNLGAKDAVKDLIEIADGHPNNFMVKNAVEALGKIGDPAAIPVLIKLMFFERQGVSFYRESSYALFLIGKPAVEPLVKLYKGEWKEMGFEEMHVDPMLQKTKALVVLGDLADPSTHTLIAEGVDLQGNDQFTALARVEAQRAAGRLGLDKTVPALLRRWDNVDISQSEHAVAALTQMGRKEVLPQLLAMSSMEGFVKNCKSQDNPEEACRQSHVQIRKPRLLAYTRLGGATELAELEKMIAEEKDEKLKAWMEEQKPRLVAAKECGDKLDCWTGKLKDGNAKVRERAAYELAWSKDPKAVDALFGALSDEDNETRYAAILGVLQKMPKEKSADDVLKILEAEKGKTQFVRINEDLKRLEVRLRRGY